MSGVQEIQDRIRQLSSEELEALRAWFIEFDAEAWDREIQEDVAAGRLDRLADEAIREHRAGRTTEL